MGIVFWREIDQQKQGRMVGCIE